MKSPKTRPLAPVRLPIDWSRFSDHRQTDSTSIDWNKYILLREYAFVTIVQCEH